MFFCCLRALLGSTAQKLRAYGVGPRESASYISYSPSYDFWAQEKFKWGILRGRKIDEEAIIRWRWIIRNRRFGLFGISRFSFGPEVDKEVYIAVGEQNETSVDIEIHAFGR